VGYFTYGLLFASFASRVSRTEDVQQGIAPITYLLLIPYFVVIFPNLLPDLVKKIMMYVPFFSPMSMPVSYATGTANLVECLISLGISLASIPLITLVCAKLYKNSILHAGQKRKLLEVFRTTQA
jgi:ABC-2 type transport system permease protein